MEEGGDHGLSCERKEKKKDLKTTEEQRNGGVAHRPSQYPRVEPIWTKGKEGDCAQGKILRETKTTKCKASTN